MKRLRSVLPFLFVALVTVLPAQSSAAGWPNWRGPALDGTAPGAKPPLQWSEQSGQRWKVPVPGSGCSSPIVWQDRVYVLTAIATERDGAPPAGEPGKDQGRGGDARGGRGGRRGPGGAAPTKVHEFVVLAYDTKDGHEVWRTKVAEGVPHEGAHPTGSLASASPLTDGERLYAFFGSRGLHCLDLAGKLLWSVEFGRMRISNQFGEGASPALAGDTLLVPWDHEGESFLVALDKKTKKELWRTPRSERTTWGTPMVADVGGKPQVILTGTKSSRAYDLKTGAQVWSCTGMTENCIPTPIVHDGTAFLMSGYRGACLQAIALDGATGDLAGSKHLLWSWTKDTSYTPSAVLYDGRLWFLKTNNGVLTCLDAATGKPHYEAQKLDGIKSVYSSPVAADGRVYITSREGVTKVIAAGKEYQELATNTLEDTFDGTMAIVGDAVYLRGRKSLYCLGAR